MTSRRTRERLRARLRAEGIGSEAVLDAIGHIPRHLFVDEAFRTRAYEDTALPIGLGQTISQPYVVARMTEIIVAANAQRVLEIGTGSGYQTAVLARVVAQVFTIERLSRLFARARRQLAAAGVGGIHFRLGDGRQGWPEQAPFDAVLVTAAHTEIPPALLAQLAPGGVLVMPVGGETQRLVVARRTAHEIVTETLEAVSFVPLLEGVQ